MVFPWFFHCSPLSPQALPSRSQRWAPQRAAGLAAAADLGSGAAAHHGDAHAGAAGSVGTLLRAMEEEGGIHGESMVLDVFDIGV